MANSLVGLLGTKGFTWRRLDEAAVEEVVRFGQEDLFEFLLMADVVRWREVRGSTGGWCQRQCGLSQMNKRNGDVK